MNRLSDSIFSPALDRKTLTSKRIKLEFFSNFIFSVFHIIIHINNITESLFHK